jgi:Skp family chaperone for outer membrane proteins
MTSALFVHYNLRDGAVALTEGGDMRAMFGTFLILALFGGDAWTQDSAVSEPNAVKIGVFDMDRFTRESDLGKEYTARVEKLQKELQDLTAQKQADLEQMDKRIKTLQEQLAKDQTTLSVEEIEKRQYEITKANREREAFFQDGQIELKRRQRQAEQKGQDINQELRNKTVPFMQEAILARDLDIVIDRRFCVFVSDDLEIAGDVIARANKANSTDEPDSN